MSQKVSITNPDTSFYDVRVTAGSALTPVVLAPGESAKFDLPITIEQGDHATIPVT